MAKKKETPSRGNSLVIVESPAKARTIGKFLGRGYTIEASIGHIRDLPNGAKEVPEELKQESWAYLGVDVTKDFNPVYIIPPNKAQQVRKLKAALKDAQDLYLATDEDREGEAISWHLCEVLNPKIPVHRLVFHEITEEAIRDALTHPRSIDQALVRAQEVRRIVDRLYGYDVSALAVEEDPAAAFRRACAERGGAADRGARAAADGLSHGHLLGPRGHLRHDPRRRDLRGRAGVGRWTENPGWPRLRSCHRRAEGPNLSSAR